MTDNPMTEDEFREFLIDYAIRSKIIDIANEDGLDSLLSRDELFNIKYTKILTGQEALEELPKRDSRIKSLLELITIHETEKKELKAENEELTRVIKLMTKDHTECVLKVQQENQKLTQLKEIMDDIGFGGVVRLIDNCEDYVDCNQLISKLKKLQTLLKENGSP